LAVAVAGVARTPGIRSDGFIAGSIPSPREAPALHGQSGP